MSAKEGGLILSAQKRWAGPAITKTYLCLGQNDASYLSI